MLLKMTRKKLLARLTSGILLIYARYELRAKEMKMNLDTGEEFVL